MSKKFIYQPISPFAINQRFGENKACVDFETGRKVITCDAERPPAGYRSLYGSKGHQGLDLAAQHGQNVYCVQRGTVDSIDTEARTGLDVRIVSVIEGKKWRHIYEHLLGYSPKIGDYIETGRVIGWADNTGYSSGNHLHLQLEEWVDGEWVPRDPLEYMEAIFARDILFMNSKIKFLQEQLAILADNIASYLRKSK